MSFLLYVIGFVVFVTGLAWLATMAGVAQTYVLVGAAVLFGAGILTAVTRARMRESA